MDKSLGTNFYLWRLFTGAKQKVTREFICTCSPPPPPPTMLDKCTRSISLDFQRCMGGEKGRGGATHFETENSAFFKRRFKNTEK